MGDRVFFSAHLIRMYPAPFLPILILSTNNDQMAQSGLNRPGTIHGFLERPR